MNTLKPSFTLVAGMGLALTCCLGTAVIQAEDLVPSRYQSDDQISVWVDNAPLGFFISQLAEITGRDASIEGDLQGQVTGRFDGSMADTLAIIGKEFPVLFDLDNDTLSVVTSTSRSSATIALGAVDLDEKFKTDLLGDVLTGNTLEIRDSEVLVSGHPSFVSRLAGIMVSAVAGADKSTITQVTATTVAPVAADGVSIETPSAKAVVDVGAVQEINAEAAAREVEAAASVETTSIAESDTNEILWVTDIPGYETF